MLRQACNQIRVWDNLFKGHSHLTLSMNFSASQTRKAILWSG